ncbi:MAG: RuvX/YqgF family protein [Patescibacteria group bacterium]
MRYLGIDYGDKRVGVALSDEAGEFAFPYIVLKNSKNLVDDVLAIAKKENALKIVVGESLDSDGNPNLIQKDIDKFCLNLKAKSEIPVFLEQEFWTSMHAKKFQGENDDHDASAAAIILQAFLDRK